jgi:hypothetical protein
MNREELLALLEGDEVVRRAVRAAAGALGAVDGDVDINRDFPAVLGSPGCASQRAPKSEGLTPARDIADQNAAEGPQ